MIQSYGWSDKLQQAFAPHARGGLIPGRVILQQRGLWSVITDRGEIDAEVSGRFAHEAEGGGYPAVGDWVALSPPQEGGPALVRALLPRRTAFVRKAAGRGGGEQVIAANVDLALLTAAADGDFNVRRLERYLALAWQSGSVPVVVLTKADLASDIEGAVEDAKSIAFGTPIIVVSAVTGAGLNDLAALLIPAGTAVLVGSSGVGKSTLVNALLGESRMATGALRARDGRGSHTTTHRELVRLPGGALLLDTPGMRELGLWDAEEGVSTAFGDVDDLVSRCRFSDCGHRGEPGCAIAAAIEAGDLDDARWRSWQKLQRELAFERAKEDKAAREARRKRTVVIAKANRQRMKFERR